MTILALDFDGVLHPLNCGVEAKLCRLCLLEEWLRGRPQVRVLISSSWREAYRLDELASFFSEDLQNRIAGVTPVYEKLFGQQWARSAANIAATRYQRQVEIERWLADTGATDERWAAVDDDSSLFEPGCKHLVVCDSTVGLTAEHLEQLDALLCHGVYDERSRQLKALKRLGEDFDDEMFRS